VVFAGLGVGSERIHGAKGRESVVA
jgi:hypothetical protein